MIRGTLSNVDFYVSYGNDVRGNLFEVVDFNVTQGEGKVLISSFDTKIPPNELEQQSDLIFDFTILGIGDVIGQIVRNKYGESYINEPLSFIIIEKETEDTPQNTIVISSAKRTQISVGRNENNITVTKYRFVGTPIEEKTFFNRLNRAASSLQTRTDSILNDNINISDERGLLYYRDVVIEGFDYFLRSIFNKRFILSRNTSENYVSVKIKSDENTTFGRDFFYTYSNEGMLNPNPQDIDCYMPGDKDKYGLANGSLVVTGKGFSDVINIGNYNTENGKYYLEVLLEGDVRKRFVRNFPLTIDLERVIYRIIFRKIYDRYESYFLENRKSPLNTLAVIENVFDEVKKYIRNSLVNYNTNILVGDKLYLFDINDKLVLLFYYYPYAIRFIKRGEYLVF